MRSRRVRRGVVVLAMLLGLLVADLPLVAAAEGDRDGSSEEFTPVEVPLPVSEPAGSLAAADPSAVPSSFVPPTGSDLLEYQTDPDADQTPVREMVESRTAVSETWVNADGSFTTKAFTEPTYFQPAGSKDLVAIDNSVVADESAPGWFRNAGNSWSVRFGPVVTGAEGVSGGVIADVEGQRLQFAPRAAKEGTIVPQVDREAGRRV